MLTTANILIPQMRSPVASSSMPPTALKSAIIIGVGERHDQRCAGRQRELDQQHSVRR
ncbi:Uncharacterised protein [Raoultella ornithinolytica]|nr:Uncharacterised protein [Raoultella ornithinolytica]